MKVFELFGEIKVDNDQADAALDETDGKASSVGSTFSNVGGKVVKAGAVMAAGIGVAVGAAGAAVTKISEVTDSIDKGAQNIGFSTTAYQEWGYVLSQNGSDIDSLTRGMATLTQKAVDASEGGTANAEAFAELGISVDDLAGMTQEQIFEATIAGLQGMEDETKKAALATELLGGSSQTLGALLNTSASDVEALKDEANDLGIVMSEDTVAAGVEMTDAIDQMQSSMLSMAAEALMPLMPMFMELMGVIMELIPPIMAFITPLIEKLVPVVGVIIEALLPVFVSLLNSLMPILNPLIDLFLLLVMALMPIIDALIPIVEALLPPLITLIESLMPIIEAWATVFTAVLTPAIEVVVGIFETLMDVIGWVVDAIDNVIGWIGDAAGAVGDFFGGIGDFVGGLFDGNVDVNASYATGTSYVPHDMVANVHRGEAIMSAEDARNWRNSGSSGGGIQIVINDAQLMSDQSMEDFADKLTNYLTGNGVTA